MIGINSVSPIFLVAFPVCCSFRIASWLLPELSILSLFSSLCVLSTEVEESLSFSFSTFVSLSVIFSVVSLSSIEAESFSSSAIGSSAEASSIVAPSAVSSSSGHHFPIQPRQQRPQSPPLQPQVFSSAPLYQSIALKLFYPFSLH